MDFRPSDEVEAFRLHVRATLDAHFTDEVVEEMSRTGTMHSWDVFAALAAEGWLTPVGYKGAPPRDPFEIAAFFEEFGRRDLPLISLINSLLISSILLHVGTVEQQDEIISKVSSGDLVLGMAYTEPDSGSDVAAARTTAVRDGDEWILEGQKMFATLAEVAGYLLLLTRSAPDLPKHQGLTMFLLPMDTPGVEVRAIRTLGGERTNVVFLNQARVSDAWRLGEVNGGWEVLRVGLSLERGLFGPPTDGSVLLDRTVAWASVAATDRPRPLDDPAVRERLARLAVANEVSALLGMRAIWWSSIGGEPGVEGAMTKLFASESYLRSSRDCIDLLGPHGVLDAAEDGAPGDGWIEHGYRHAPVTTIYGGTSEILRGLIAERFLGLPRAGR